MLVTSSGFGGDSAITYFLRSAFKSRCFAVNFPLSMLSSFELGTVLLDGRLANGFEGRLLDNPINVSISSSILRFRALKH